MPVPMIDLVTQYRRIKAEIDAAVAEVFAAQEFVGGANVERLESAVATYTGASHAVGVASGTDALILLLRAAGVQPGDEVITTPFSFFATAGSIANIGAVPVFADIDPVTFNIIPDLIAQRITDKTRAIVPVHLYGQCADMDPIMALADKHGLFVIEDAAQALGARYKGRAACTLGSAAALSFYPTKNLGGAGDGGMVVTTNAATSDRVRLLRSHGANATYIHSIVGTNSRLDAVQASVLRVKLRYLDQWNEERRTKAAYYSSRLAGVDGVVTPTELESNYHIYHQYVIRVPKRDALRQHLIASGIGCAVFYPRPLHQQECFEHLGYRAEDCPVAEKASQEVLALPMFAELTHEQQDEVVNAIKAFFAQE